MGTVGAVSNPDNQSTNLGKAGRNRWLGKRPLTRRVAKNPLDHPHGGGEARTSGGRLPVTPWGPPTKGAHIGRPSSRDRVCQSLSISLFAAHFKQHLFPLFYTLFSYFLSL